jgi:serine/threonine-protein kinase
VDRNGNEEKVVEAPGFYSDPALSPDGRRLALSIIEPGATQDVWVLDLARQAFARLTSGGGADFAPIWTDDGRDLIYTAETPVFDLFRRPADGSRPAEPLLVDEFDKYPIDVRDGVLTLDWSTVPEGRAITLALDGSGQLDTILTAPGAMDNPSVSPDGRWLAYTSDESGQDEVYVSRFPDVAEGRQQISSGGGREPRWVGGALELVFRDGPNFVSVLMDPASGQPSTPEVLFPDEYMFDGQSIRGYDVTEDGSRFVVMKVQENRRPRRVMLVTNFFEELRSIRPN